MDTATDVFAAGAGAARAGKRAAVLTVALRANAPLEPPSRHVLDEIDVIVFRRGERRAIRDTHDSLRRLVLQVPDPVMSGDHGRLLHVHGHWILEDPASKNGAVVTGRPTRVAGLRPGDLFQLGHTLFLLEIADVRPALPRDVSSSELAPALAGLATFHAQLGVDVETLGQVAATEVPVILLGETGTGKEVAARALHAASGRRGPFVAVNCAAIPQTLVEAELFGHRKGAFSGAISDRPGYLRSADGGTLFLDEIGELAPPAQAALLRALQEREVVPVGDSRPIPVDLRIVAATNRDLADLAATGRFREDLYARLLGVSVTLPPLRERRADIGLLGRALLARLPGGDRARFVPAAAYALLRHDWPLNVRELEQCLRAALALAGRAPIDLAHLPPRLLEPPAPAPAEAAESADPPTGPGRDLEGDVDQLRATLVELLTRHHGNVAAVARELGKHREQVHRWVRRLEIDIESFRR